MDPKLIEAYPATDSLPVVSSPARRSEWPLALFIRSIAPPFWQIVGRLGSNPETGLEEASGDGYWTSRRQTGS